MNHKSVFICVIRGRLIHPWGMIFFRKYLFRFILPQIAQIFTDFLLRRQQLLADEWMCSTDGKDLCE